MQPIRQRTLRVGKQIGIGLHIEILDEREEKKTGPVQGLGSAHELDRLPPKNTA
jgi:hypothetical protein